jgi:hypothetical protein
MQKLRRGLRMDAQFAEEQLQHLHLRREAGRWENY